MSRCHRIFLASAGTGKTYRLSGRFLDLLLAKAPPRSILATTFTRKAAGEILDRVLERLVETIDSADARKDLADQRDFGDGFESREALELLATLVRHLDRFEVRTLDSFLIHLGQLFALDLDLAPQWSVAQGPEAVEVIAEALARLLNGVQGRDEEEQFAELLREITSSKGAGRSVHAALNRLVTQGRDVFLDSLPEAWTVVQAGEPVDPERLAETAAAIESLEVPKNKGNGEEKKSWQKAHGDLLTALERKDWKSLLGIGLFKKFIHGEDKFDRVLIDEPWREALDVLKEQAAHYLVSTVVARNGRAVELLGRFEGLLGDVKRELGLYEFADIPRALAPGAPGEAGPIAGRELDLAYRLDAHLHHLLLDEFQDTAPTQWRVLSPLAEEICADGSGDKSFFCVGDVKQSIYGWRSAEPRLLASLGEHLHVEPEPLHENWRSSTVILDTVNQVFGSIDTLSVFQAKGKEVHQRAAAAFQARFNEHVAAKDLPGVAEIRQAPPHGPDAKRWMPVIDLAVQRVVALAREKPSATIGVLVRSNKTIPFLIAKLQVEGLLVSGEGGNPLTDSAAVLHFLSLLHLADHPSDSMAAFHLAGSPLPEALGITDPAGDPAGLARVVRERLFDQGLGNLCAELEPAVRDHDDYNEWDQRRYRQLGDLAFAQFERASLRADRFVDLVRTHKMEDPAAARIKVMTVHASKGLEFDAVILPELDDPLAKNRWPFLTERPDPRGLFTAATVNPSMDVAKLDPTLTRLFEGQSMREVEEALCVLYVGMTRAKHRLELLLRDRSKGEGGTSPAGILRSALVQDPVDGEVLWRHGNSAEDWLPGADDRSDPPTVEEDLALKLAPTSAPRRLSRRSPSAEEGGTRLTGASLLDPPSSAGTRRGSLVHRFLEQVEWLDDAPLDEQALLAVGAEIEPDEAQRREALAYLKDALSSPDIRTALTLPMDGDTQVELWREREFCLVLSDDRGPASWKGAFDRVVLERTDGKYTGATIQDYKTDDVSGEQVDERAAYYAPQLHAYRRALAAMTGLEEAAIGAELLFLTPGVVSSIPAVEPV